MKGGLIKIACIGWLVLTAQFTHEAAVKKGNVVLQAFDLATLVMSVAIVVMTWREEDAVDIRWGMPTLLHSSMAWIRWWAIG